MTNTEQKQKELEEIKNTIRVLQRLLDIQWESGAPIKVMQDFSGAFKAALERRDSLEQYLRFA